MTVRLEGTIHRWAGLSTDDKPTPGYADAAGTVLTARDVPPGSTFKDEKGRIWAFDGATWNLPEVADAVSPLVEAIGLLRQEVAQLRLGLIEAEMCSDVSADDALAVITAGHL